MSFDRNKVKAKLEALAGNGIWLGTSSWKYPGWRGQLYDESRYVWRGRFAESRFERLCLSGYAEVFKTVCVDAAYYKFPTRSYLEGLANQVPADFQFAFKVTDEITVKHFPNLPRFGRRAGQPNGNFLNADLFAAQFTNPCESIRDNVGLMIFEFSRFYPPDFASGREFLEVLDAFLGRLPEGWRYGVEIRNPNFLRPEYFETLKRHGVSHVFNSWSDMPPIDEQSKLEGGLSTGSFGGARLLLRPGRKYEDAVKRFSPYERVQDPYPEGRRAAAELIREAAERGAKLFIYVNNRFEGNALQTISGILEASANRRDVRPG